MFVFCNALHSSSSNECDVEKRKKTKRRIASCFSSLVVGRRRRRVINDDIDDERKISKVLPRGRASVVPVHVAKLTGKVPHVRRKRDTVRERNVTRRGETKRNINSRFRRERGSVEKQHELFCQREEIQRVRVGFTRVRVHDGTDPTAPGREKNDIYNFYTWARQINKFIETEMEGEDKRAFLMCNSVGGVAGLQAPALDKRENILGLCLINISMRGLHVTKQPRLRNRYSRRFRRF